MIKFIEEHPSHTHTVLLISKLKKDFYLGKASKSATMTFPEWFGFSGAVSTTRLRPSAANWMKLGRAAGADSRWRTEKDSPLRRMSKNEMESWVWKLNNNIIGPYKGHLKSQACFKTLSGDPSCWFLSLLSRLLRSIIGQRGKPSLFYLVLGRFFCLALKPA